MHLKISVQDSRSGSLGLEICSDCTKKAEKRDVLRALSKATEEEAGTSQDLSMISSTTEPFCVGFPYFLYRASSKKPARSYGHDSPWYGGFRLLSQHSRRLGKYPVKPLHWSCFGS